MRSMRNGRAGGAPVAALLAGGALVAALLAGPGGAVRATEPDGGTPAAAEPAEGADAPAEAAPATPAAATGADTAPAGLAGALTQAPADPPPPLTPFQWALKTGGSLLLVPHEGHLYPARRTGAGVIETLPEAIEVALHHDGTALTVPLHAVRSPFEVLGGDWVLERRGASGWRPVAAMHFHGDRFYGQDAPGPFEPLPPDAIRLRRR